MDHPSLATARDALKKRESVLEVTRSATVAAVALALLSIPFVPGYLPAMALTASLLGFATAWLRHARNAHLEQLAADPDAYLIPEVRRYGARLASHGSRRRLAKRIEAIVTKEPGPCSIWLTDRVAAHGGELRRLAADLASIDLHVRPTSAAACWRLLTRAPVSPLYNDRLPVEDLLATLIRIRAGISRYP